MAELENCTCTQDRLCYNIRYQKIAHAIQNYFGFGLIYMGLQSINFVTQ